MEKNWSSGDIILLLSPFVLQLLTFPSMVSNGCDGVKTTGTIKWTEGLVALVALVQGFGGWDVPSIYRIVKEVVLWEISKKF